MLSNMNVSKEGKLMFYILYNTCLQNLSYYTWYPHDTPLQRNPWLSNDNNTTFCVLHYVITIKYFKVHHRTRSYTVLRKLGYKNPFHMITYGFSAHHKMQITILDSHLCQLSRKFEVQFPACIWHIRIYC